jgi:peptidoglycan hydrolase CwlO-like protein
MAEQQLTADQVYLQAILEKFNKDPEDPTLQEVEKVLLAKIRDVQQEIAKLAKEVETTNTEIRERQEKGNNLVQQVIHKQGQSQGYIDSLLALKK